VAFIAAWAILTGALEIAGAVFLRHVIRGEWLLAATGIVSVVLGILLAVMPAAGLIAWTWMIGAYALIYGCLLIALAFRLHRIGSQGASGRLAGQH
jgi:uncharacterized membrane protein HdeD (DUF308 family)